MKVWLSLAVLAAGLVASVWFANWFVRARPDEPVEDAFVRIVRKVVSAMGALLVTLLVMVGWVADQNSDLKVTSRQVAANAQANCESQRVAEADYETALIADVRIARAQLTAAVDMLQQVNERLAVPPLDLSRFGPEIQAAVNNGREQLEHEQERTSAFVDAIAAEVKTRENTLDAARENTIGGCPQIPITDD